MREIMMVALIILTAFAGLCYGFRNQHVASSPVPSFLPSHLLQQQQQQQQRTSRNKNNSFKLHMVSNSKKITAQSTTSSSDDFLTEFFTSECDDFNQPPSLSILMRSIAQLPSGSDIRGRFVDHSRLGAVASIAHEISKNDLGSPALTPFAAHCLGYAFARMLLEQYPDKNSSSEDDLIIALGKDPRTHGSRLADSFARGAQGVQNVRVVYTGIATTPAMFDFCRESLCEGGVMVTASHLPADRNGFKFFTAQGGGFTKAQIQRLVSIAKEHAQMWYDMGIIPPASGEAAVFCSEWVDWMPNYESNLKRALVEQIRNSYDDAEDTTTVNSSPLKGLTIVLNSGNGSGGFFQQVLEDLGADVSGSINIPPNAKFPAGIPNPENNAMIEETIKACEEVSADLGILLDTDADRCGFVVPRTVDANDGTCGDYEPLNRNRLIALLSVLFSRTSPGCAIVTDSVTSEGLANFLKDDLGLIHVRYLKGYANVIQKARTLTEETSMNAEVAIETSGHCALKENDYLDDGTYTAVKVVGLLANEKSRNANACLLDLISNLREMEEESELRMKVTDGSLETTQALFDFIALEVETMCETHDSWTLDRENLEGIRVSTGGGGFFMLRKSLHDPILSLQVEASSKDEAREVVLKPLLEFFETKKEDMQLEFSALTDY